MSNERKSMLQIFLDVETKNIFDEVGGFFPEKLGISFVGLYVREGFSQGEFQSYFENDLDKLFPLLEKADVVIGFNINGFDMPVLNSYYQSNIERIPTMDLLEKIKLQAGHRISLNAVAQETLGVGKLGDGLDAIKYFRSGDFESLEKYCLKDVEITRDLYDYGLKHGYVKFKNKWNRLIESPVDFSFVPNIKQGLQLSLI